MENNMQNLIKYSFLAAFLALAGLGFMDPVLAREAAEAAAPAIDSGDRAWMLT